MHVKLLAVFVLFSVGMSSSAYAAIQANRCNACSEAQYETTAMNIASQNGQGRGYVYIYDLISHNFRKFSIESEPMAGGYQYTAIPADRTAQEDAAWTAADHAVTANGGRANFFGHIDARTTKLGLPDRNASSFDIMLTTAYQNDISNWLLNASQTPLLNDGINTLNSLFSTALSIVLKQDLFSVTLTLTTADGGTIDFFWEVGYNHTTITRALDPDGNNIPLHGADIPGHYRFGTGHEPNFRDYLGGRFGSNVAFGGSLVCVNGILACTNSAAGYSCQWFSCGGVP